MTRPQGAALARQQERTHPGMAHWAGSGPEGKMCRECVSWCRPADAIRSSYSRDGNGRLTPRRCRMFVSLMRRGDPDIEAGPGVPYDAAACRHFEMHNDPPRLLGRNAPEVVAAKRKADAEKADRKAQRAARKVAS